MVKTKLKTLHILEIIKNQNLINLITNSNYLLIVVIL